MKTASIPDNDFSSDVEIDTLTRNDAMSGWSETDEENDTYTTVYDVDIASEDVDDVTVTTTGGEDVAENDQEADDDSTENIFDVDTVNPTVITSVVVTVTSSTSSLAISTSYTVV